MGFKPGPSSSVAHYDDHYTMWAGSLILFFISSALEAREWAWGWGPILYWKTIIQTSVFQSTNVGDENEFEKKDKNCMQKFDDQE